MDKKIKLLQHYSSPEIIDTIQSWTEEQRKELLSLLGMEKKEKIISWNQKSIKMLCEQKIASIFRLEKDVHKEKNQEISQKQYISKYIGYRESYLRFLDHSVKEGEITLSNHVFDHTQSHDFHYKSGTLLEKIKFKRGMGTNYFMRNWKDKNTKKDWNYLRLDPDRVESEFIDMIKNHTKKNKYGDQEKIILKDRLMGNEEIWKNILSSAEPLIVAQSNGIDSEPTERIVKLKDGENIVGYMVSEHSPIRYEENHLKKYRGEDIRFEIFSQKKDLVVYLQNQLFYMDQQVKRFNEAKEFFKFLDPTTIENNKESLEGGLKNFSFHKTYTDQAIFQLIQGLLSSEKRGRKQKISAIFDVIEKGIQESQEKRGVMQQHLGAVVSNPLF